MKPTQALVPTIADPRTRALALQRRIEDALATRTEDAPHGTALFRDDLPLVADTNVLRIETVPAILHAAELIEECEALQSGRPRRSIRVEDAIAGARLAPGFAAAGWIVQRNALMVARGAPDRPVDTSGVARVSLHRIEAAREAAIGHEHRDLDVAAEVLRAGAIQPVAFELRAYAAVVGGEVASYCLLQLTDRGAKLAEIGALARSHGRGVSRAVVCAALAAARGEHAGTILVECHDEEWQKSFYRRLGFVEVGSMHRFVRPWGDDSAPAA